MKTLQCIFSNLESTTPVVLEIPQWQQLLTLESLTKKTCVTSNSRNYLVFRMGTIALWWEAELPNKHPLLAPLTPGSCPFLNEADLIMLFLFKILYNIVQVPVFSFSSRFPQTGEFRFSPGFMSPCLPPTARSPIQFMSPT